MKIRKLFFAAFCVATVCMMHTSTVFASGSGSIYGPALNDAQLAQVKAVADAFLANYITPDMSDYDKLLVAHNYLKDTVDYAETWAQNGANTAWGALVYHEAQCSGYARAYKALCDSMGIECYYVHADENAFNPSHQWNIVKLEGQYYIVDVQGDDKSSEDFGFLIGANAYPDIYSYDKTMYPALAPTNYGGNEVVPNDQPAGEKGMTMIVGSVLPADFSLTAYDFPVLSMEIARLYASRPCPENASDREKEMYAWYRDLYLRGLLN